MSEITTPTCVKPRPHITHAHTYSSTVRNGVGAQGVPLGAVFPEQSMAGGVSNQ